MRQDDISFYNFLKFLCEVLNGIQKLIKSHSYDILEMKKSAKIGVVVVVLNSFIFGSYYNSWSFATRNRRWIDVN